MLFSLTLSGVSAELPRYPNENARFKAEYGRSLRHAFLAAAVLTLMVFLLSPQFVPSPYVLRDEGCVLYEFPEEILIPERPRNPPMPIPPIEPAAEDEGIEIDIPVTTGLVDDDWRPPLPPSTPAPPNTDWMAIDTKPVLIHQEPARYPEMARDMELSGTVYVDVLVDDKGWVAQAVVSSGVHPLVDREALRAARRCRFLPGKQQDFAVPVWVTLPYAFVLYR